jgi:hypothetical protein
VHVNTIEGFWSLLRSRLRPHRSSRHLTALTIPEPNKSHSN